MHSRRSRSRDLQVQSNPESNRSSGELCILDVVTAMGNRYHLKKGSAENSIGAKITSALFMDWKEEKRENQDGLADKLLVLISF